MNNSENLDNSLFKSDKTKFYKRTTTSWQEEDKKTGLVRNITVEEYKEFEFLGNEKKVIEVDDDLIKFQELQAISYIEKEIVPIAEDAEKGGIVAQTIWMDLLLNWLKKLSISLAGKALGYLMDKAIPWAVDAAGFALEKLQDFLYDKYQSANEKEKELFKNKILEKFPDSGLASKLRNE